jgi:hypothetical protein
MCDKNCKVCEHKGYCDRVTPECTGECGKCPDRECENNPNYDVCKECNTKLINITGGQENG